MRAQRAQAGQRGAARDVSLPLPIGGLFSEASNAEMRAVYAGEMLNWKSTGALLETRPQAILSDGPSSAVQRIPFEFSGRSLYIETTPNQASAGAATFARSFDGRASVAYISGRAIIADGRDDPLTFDGTTFAPSAFTTETAVTQDEFDGIVAHHDRPYLWKRGGDLEFYYGDVGAVTGALQRFPLGRLGNITGSISEIASLTVDAGHGMNDVLAIMTSTGQVVIYEGLDPGDAQDWRLLSRIKVAPPASSRSFTQIGSDAWMLTTSGIISVGESLRQGAMALVSKISRPILDEILRAIEEGGDWQLHTSADSSFSVINRTYLGVSQQWVYYLESGSWATADYPADVWHNLGQATGFTAQDGCLGKITRSQTAGEPMLATLHTGWFRAGTSGLASITPTILAKGPLAIRIAVLTDHNETASDLAEAWQTVTIDPNNSGDGIETIAISDTIGLDAVGDVYQLRLEVTARWAQIVNITLAVN